MALDPLTAPVLPDSRASFVSTPKSARLGPLGWMVPVYCANCGIEGGRVPQENMTGVFWICDKCAETLGEIPGTMSMPDEVFFARVAQEQLEKYGRHLTAEETIVALSDPDSLESKLARDRVALTPPPGA